MKKFLLACIGIAGFLILYGAAGLCDNNAISASEAFLRAGIGTALFIGSIAVYGKEKEHDK